MDNAPEGPAARPAGAGPDPRSHPQNNPQNNWQNNLQGHQTPAQQSPQFSWPTPSGFMVSADPESAGLKRTERPGWAVGLAGLGAIMAIVSFFVGWFRVSTFFSLSYLESKGRPTNGPVSPIEREWPSPFTVVEVVDRTSRETLVTQNAGPVASIVFPWLLIVLTVACCALVAIAALGLQRKSLTRWAQVAALALVVVTAGVVVLALFDVGFTKGGMVYGSGGPEVRHPIYTSWKLEPDAGLGLWLLGLLLLGVAAAIGPRIVHRLPDGTQVGHGAGHPMTGPVGAVGFPGAVPFVRVTTKISAIVAAGLGAVIGFAGYGFLPWGEDTTFSDIGEAARDHGFEDRPFTEAYFAWLGWVILALAVVALVALALGRAETGISATVMRPILTILLLLAGLAHAWALVDLGSDGAELGIGAYAVGLGLVLCFIGAVAPLNSSARVMMHPASAGQPPRA